MSNIFAIGNEIILLQVRPYYMLSERENNGMSGTRKGKNDNSSGNDLQEKSHFE